MISFNIKLSKADSWTSWWVKHHDYLTDVESLPVEAQGSQNPTDAYHFSNVGETSYFTYGVKRGGITDIFTFSTHFLKLRDSKNYVINIDTNYVFEEGKPWQGWKPSLNPLPWLPSKGPPLPKGLFPPWPWVWF